MKIIRLQAEGFKRLVAVDITPEGGLVEVRGLNGEGKSSLLDSIMAALGGADGFPVKPVRTGEEYAIIRADLGDIKVTRYFGADGATSLKVENADGARYDKGQTKIDDLVGRIAFDPLAFKNMKPADQAAELRRLVPITHEVDGERVPLDLAALAKADKDDVEARRDVNRDGKALVARVDAINVSGIVPEKPDRDAIVAELTGAADTNTAIERERLDRERRRGDAQNRRDTAVKLGEEVAAKRAEAERLLEEAKELEVAAMEAHRLGNALDAELDALVALADPVDTAEVSARLAQADRDLALLARIEEKATLTAQVDALRAKSEAFTAAIAARAELRAKALAEAEMPVEGLGFAAFGDSEDLVVSYRGEPFSQVSGAEQLRVSMGIAIADNPKLRVMLIRDGSLLDKNGLAIVREMASAGDYQIWLESVGDEGSGIIMEAGAVRGADEPERVEPPKRRKKADGDPMTDSGGGPTTEKDVGSRIVSPGDEFEGSGIEPNRPRTVEGSDGLGRVEAPRRERPRAMREMTTAPVGGLFGDDPK